MANYDQRRESLRRLPLAREEPVSLAPPSSVGKRWNPLGVAFAAAAVFGSATTFGVAIGPYFSKPDLSGYVKEERLTACEARVTARDEAHEKALDGERSRTSECYDKLGTCRSQAGASRVVIESYEENLPKSRRMPRVER